MIKCLFLGYDRKKTKLISLLEKNGCKVINLKRQLLTKDLKKNDIYISFGYRKIISKKILRSAKRPIINLHLSYLPFNRGAYPNFWSFVDNTQSGVTIHEIDKGIDTGPILYQKKNNFKATKSLTFKSTYKILFKEIENLFKRNLKKILNNTYKTKKQGKKYTFHKKSDLPKKFRNWDKKILSYKKFI